MTAFVSAAALVIGLELAWGCWALRTVDRELAAWGLDGWGP